MYFKFCNAIFYATIILIMSSWAQKACNESLMNATKIFSNQNETNCWSDGVKEKITEIRKDETNVPGIARFLARPADLSILNIPFNNNDKDIDILKSALSSNEAKANKTNVGNEKENYFDEAAKNFTASDLIYTRNISNDNSAAEEINISTQRPIQKGEDFTIFKISQTNYENSAIDILKATATSFLPAKEVEHESKESSKNLPAMENTSQNFGESFKDANDPNTKFKDQTTSTKTVTKIEDQKVEHENKGSSKTLPSMKNTSHNFGENFKDSNETETKFKDQTTSTETVIKYEDQTTSTETVSKIEDQTLSSEIILSEIKNIPSENGEQASLGQKLKFQRSKKDLEEGDTNTVGKEILQNTTAICGYLLGKRVSFAEPTTLMEFPWTALLLYNTNLRYHCGGSLITTKYVLTAAHCVTQEFYELTGVRLGEYDISEPIDCALDIGGSKICATTVDVDVLKIIVHHDYSHLSFKNDIALLRLDKDYLGRSFYPICLPTPEMIYGQKTATVAGWGATEKAIRSSILLKATVPIFDISKCREIYRYNVFNDTTEICASGANEVDVCKGDSGGAIFYNEDIRGREKFFQLGIISLGVRGCGDKRFLPAIFTRLNAYYKWIENNLEY